ncbi:hypothetical protein [Labrys neptuniae]
MQIWNYEAGSGALIGPGTADPCPIEAGQYLVPANATSIAPPEFDPETETCTFKDDTWTVSPRPAEGPEPKRELPQIAAESSGICAAIAQDILRQIYPDPIRQAAIQSAAAVIIGNGGSAPTSGPAAQKVRDLARLHIKGAEAVEIFSSIVVTLQLATIDLNIALASAEMTIAAARKVAQIKAAVDAFQASIVTIVANINESRLPAPVVPPEAIVIPGINA